MATEGIVFLYCSYICNCAKNPNFANCRFSFRKLHILISQTTDFYFANYRFSFRFVSQATVSPRSNFISLQIIFHIILPSITGTPANSNFFLFPLKVRIIGSRLFVWKSSTNHWKQRTNLEVDWNISAIFSAKFSPQSPHRKTSSSIKNWAPIAWTYLPIMADDREGRSSKINVVVKTSKSKETIETEPTTTILEVFICNIKSTISR